MTGKPIHPDVLRTIAARTPRLAAVLSALGDSKASVTSHRPGASDSSTHLSKWICATGLSLMLSSSLAMDVATQVAAWDKPAKSYYGVERTSRLVNFPNSPITTSPTLRRQETMMIASAILRVAYANRIDRTKDEGAFLRQIEQQVLTAADIIAPNRALYTLTPAERNSVATLAMFATLPVFLHQADEAVLSERERSLKTTLVLNPSAADLHALTDAFRRAIHGLVPSTGAFLTKGSTAAELLNLAAIASEKAMEKFNALSRYEQVEVEDVNLADNSNAKPF